jgi:hypothetical protein
MEQTIDNPSNFEKNFQDIKDLKHVYHYEYTNIHNQRIALVGQMHLWHQIGFPAAYIVFGFFFSHGISQQCSLFFLVGSIFGTLIVFFARNMP